MLCSIPVLADINHLFRIPVFSQMPDEPQYYYRQTSQRKIANYKMTATVVFLKRLKETRSHFKRELILSLQLAILSSHLSLSLSFG